LELPIKWSPEAVEDLEQIVEYIEKDSEYYATAVVSETLNIVQKIEEYPLSGRKVPEIDDEKIREYLLYSYRIIYQIQEHYILIVAIIHGKRQIENIKNRFG
jgi:toxin ParE1/3/4